MPDRRQNRGAHPHDAACFAVAVLEPLRRATAELSWLLSRGYSETAALKLVGDRHTLRTRQRDAMKRCAVADDAVALRRQGLSAPQSLQGRRIDIDGYNVLLTIEAALSKAVILHARDGVFRDMAAMSSHYRRVQQTRPALALIGQWLEARECREARWFLDRPVSNSGRLKTWIEAVAEQHGWSWKVELVPDPDPTLAQSTHLVATADGGILDQGPRWINVARHVVEAAVPDAWIADLSDTAKDGATD